MESDSIAQSKALFFEIGGPGLASINYDMRFQKNDNGLGGRIGVGGFTLNEDGDKISAIFLPIGVKLFIGKRWAQLL